ncbi:MAG: TetR/AcrR family transcriptional regulator [Jatrophihabitans sp.]
MRAVKILGLRERKKRRTREAITDAAIRLFIEHGFDRVSVSDVAAAADVSKVTVFNYFPTKEDLVLAGIADQTEQAARTVSNRGAQESPLQALRHDYLQRLAAHDPSTGLCDEPHFVAVQRMILSTPTLTLRVTHHLMRSEASLSTALSEYLGQACDSLAARVAASQLLAVERALVSRNLKRILAGSELDQLYIEAVSEAEFGFAVIEGGLAKAGFGSADG